MQFQTQPPALLHDTESGWVGYWDIATGNAGLTDEQLASWVSASLNDPRGWGRAGITFQRSSTAHPRVTFRSVQILSGHTIGLTYWSSYDGVQMRVDLEAGQYPFADLVNHESGHAFFMASHSPEGSDSIMEPIDEPSDEWPSDSDIAQVEAWLGNSVEATTFWFPGDLPTYMTYWDIPTTSVARLHMTVLEGAPAIVRPVSAPTHEQMISGDYSPFARALDAYHKGFYWGGWEPPPVGPQWVGIVVQTENPEDISDLVLGLAEVQIKGG